MKYRLFINYVIVNLIILVYPIPLVTCHHVPDNTHFLEVMKLPSNLFLSSSKKRVYVCGFFSHLKDGFNSVNVLKSNKPM